MNPDIWSIKYGEDFYEFGVQHLKFDDPRCPGILVFIEHPGKLLFKRNLTFIAKCT